MLCWYDKIPAPIGLKNPEVSSTFFKLVSPISSCPSLIIFSQGIWNIQHSKDLIYSSSLHRTWKNTMNYIFKKFFVQGRSLWNSRSCNNEGNKYVVLDQSRKLANWWQGSWRKENMQRSFVFKLTRKKKSRGSLGYDIANIHVRMRLLPSNLAIEKSASFSAWLHLPQTSANKLFP